MDLLKTLGLNPVVVLVQMAGFIVLYLLLKKLLWEPFGRQIDERHGEWKSSGEHNASTKATQETLAQDYAAKIAVIERQAYERLQALVKDGVSARTDALAKAQDEATKALQDAQTAIRSEKDRALQQAGPQVDALAKEAAGKALGKAVA